ncbi:MAG: type II secretion system minor pseudopilin GspI [Gammaproteobacteria bacterium]
MASRFCARGFTLLEAMVALAIVALGMMAVNTQLNRYAVTAVFIEEKTLASWIGSNVLTEFSIAPQWPEIDTTEGDVEFAQRDWVWEAEVSETPVENLRRVDIAVALAADPSVVIHRVSGLVEPPAPQGFVPLSWLSAGAGFDGGGPTGGMGGMGGMGAGDEGLEGGQEDGQGGGG